MKKQLLLLLGAGSFTLLSPSAKAVPVFADSFTYPTGNLVGQGPWLTTGTVVTSPIQVTAGGAAAVGPTGQDVFAALSTPLNNVAGNSLFIGATINVSAAGSGDYFLHLTTTVGSTSGFFDKIFAKSTTGGFVLGASDNSSTGTYGTGVLSFGTSYRIVLEEDYVAGDKNDTFELYVSPTDLTVPGNNAAYESFTWTSTASEPATLAGVNFRQGGGSAVAPTVAVDDLDVSGTFSDASTFTVPEPSTMALFGLGAAIAGLVSFRRRK
jgi:hypothetical protein